MVHKKTYSKKDDIGICRKCGKHFDDYEGKPHRKYMCRECWNLQSKTSYRKSCQNLDVYFKLLINTIRNSKDRKDLPFDIDVPFLMELFELQNGRCAISNIEMTWGQHDPKDGRKIYRSPYNVSIERLDGIKGYTRENVVLLCYSVNVFKNEHDISIVHEIAEEIIKNKNRLNEVLKSKQENLSN